MHAYEKNWVRLPLEGAHNARELGGYPTSDGGQTAYHRFVRSDNLHELTDADVAFLRGYGVSLVIDLRGADEASSIPDRSLGPDVETLVECLIDFDASSVDDIRRLIEENRLSASEVYCTMLDNKATIASVFHAMAAARPGCILFHCHAGKDRTGVVAALLLMLAGVSRQDICTNYMQTRENLLCEAWYKEKFETSEGLELQMIDSDPTTIGGVYDHVVKTYGTAEAYLMSCGVSEKDLAALKERLAG